MGITSLQVCMDSSDWLHQGTISEEYIGGGIMDSSPISTPSGGGGGDDENNINSILACGGRSPTLLAAERSRLRPQHEQSPKCPRCESTHTKFCYYNNYSLSQPRYFCKTCRRYWTKGGTLRNIPVGGGCRKNKKVSSSSSSAANNKKSDHHPPPPPSSALVPLNRNNNNPSADDDENHVHLGFSDQLHFSSLHASGFFNNAGNNNNNFMLDNNNNNIINNHHAPIDFMDNKYDDFGGMMITGNGGGGNNAEDHNAVTSAVNFHGFPFGLSSSFLDHHHGSSNSAPINILESCQRLMLPYDNPNQNQNHNHDYHNHNHNHNHNNNNNNNHELIDVKPNSKILSLEWNDYHNHHHHQQSTGYNFGGLGSWTGLMNGYGSNPATNPLV